MRDRWWLLFDGMEKMAFKPVLQGWIYSAPRPWVFGAARHYLLNQEQKTRIATELRRFFQVQFIAIMIAVAIAVPLAMPWLNHHPLAALGGSLLFGLAIALACNAYLCRRLAPMLAGLEPTTQKITMRDGLRTQVMAFSRRRMPFFGMLSMVMCALSALRPLLEGNGWDLWSVFGVLLFGSGTIYWFVLLFVNRREQRAT